jgi:hypothetical protein
MLRSGAVGHNVGALTTALHDVCITPEARGLGSKGRRDLEAELHCPPQDDHVGESY